MQNRTAVFGRQDFVYIAEEDAYRCPAGERLIYRFSAEQAASRPLSGTKGEFVAAHQVDSNQSES